MKRNMATPNLFHATDITLHISSSDVMENPSLSVGSYKDNYCREGIRIANARPKVIIFCKSRWDLVTLQ